MASTLYTNNENRPGSIIYIPHGGGPWPLLGDTRHTDLINFFKTVTTRLITPAAILVISAHWEAERPTVTAAKNPQLIYDYHGFPEETYKITYPAPGNVELAENIIRVLQQHGIPAKTDTSRGFDHGFFVPLKIMYPQASIPCVQLSLINTLDPADHIAMGRALADMDDDNLLFIGSGASFHNLRVFHEPPSEPAENNNNAFEEWLVDTMSSRQLNETTRQQRLENWRDAPAAGYCHPREEHLLPLHVCYGVAGAPASHIEQVTFLGKRTSAHIW